MTSNNKVSAIIFKAVDELNQQLPGDQRLEKSAETALSGRLDSLGLVNLIVATEQKIDEDLGVTINLFDERAMSQEDNPFRNIDSLADYISRLLEERANG